MLGFLKRKVAEDLGPQSVSDEFLLKEAYRIGRYGPSNCECPPAPSVIPVWIENNVEAFEILVDRLYREYRVREELSPRIYQRIYEGFCDLVRAQPDEGDSPFCLCREEVLVHAREIFLALAKKKQVSLDLI
ncbi:MAG: hypothetical protein M1509_02770 [Nitrospirae bacterium]|nr:hypothetical protein [Nitrospirota bacterium]